MHIAGEDFLFLSEDRDTKSPRIASRLLTFNTTTNRFEVFQSIPTDGAHAAELFEGPGGKAYLAIANFGDRLGKRYASDSSVWEFDEQKRQFKQIATVPTQGATDWEHFSMQGRHYLVVSNEGDVSNGKFQISHAYELMPAASDSGPAARSKTEV